MTAANASNYFQPWTGEEAEECDFCMRVACAQCDMCNEFTCPEHTVRLGEDESYCPNCNPRIR